MPAVRNHLPKACLLAREVGGRSPGGRAGRGASPSHIFRTKCVLTAGLGAQECSRGVEGHNCCVATKGQSVQKLGVISNLFVRGNMAKDKVHKVMKEYKEGKLHSGSKKGPKVKSRKQAIAIAMSEARRGK